MTVQLNPSFIQNKGYTARIDRQVLSDDISVGVVPDGGMLITTTGAAARTTQAAKGACYVQGTLNADQGIYRVFNDASLTITHAAAVTNPRVDIIVARVYDSVENSGVGADQATIEIVAGTETSGATAQNRLGAVAIGSLPANSYALAYVAVPVGASPAIPGGNIVDLRGHKASPRVAQGIASDTMQNGVIATGDFVVSSLAVSGAGVVSGAISAGTCWIKNAAGLLVRHVLPASISFSIAPGTLPASTKFAVVGIELVVSNWDGSPTIQLSAKGSDQATGALALTNTPATTSGALRILDVVIENNVGTYRLPIAGATNIDRRPWANGGVGYNQTTSPHNSAGTTICPIRLECTGALMLASYDQLVDSSTSTTLTPSIALTMDGSSVTLSGSVGGALRDGTLKELFFTSGGASQTDQHGTIIFTPTAGSHLFQLTLINTTAGNTEEASLRLVEFPGRVSTMMNGVA